jgi:multicomponent Na+:H+ antiporter subunit D
MQATSVPLAAWLVILPVLLPLFGAALLIAGAGRTMRPTAFAVLVTLLTAAIDALLLRHVFIAGPLAMTMGRWLPPFGISFAADVLGAGFSLLAAVVTACVLVYRVVDAGAPAAAARGLALILVLLAGVDGGFLTGDLFNLYVWFELILIASFGLLVLGGTPLTVDATVKYGLLNFVATSLFLAALGLLYGALGTLNMADVVHAAGSADPAVMAGIGVLLVVAFGTKAAAFPLNAWLPASYHAPSAAISGLLGGLLTKVGAYALLRTLILVLPAEGRLLHPVLAIVGGATLLLGPLGAIAVADLRRSVGFLLIGGIGSIVAGLALASPAGIAGAVVYVVNAMLTITALYLVAGLVETRTGRRDSLRMGGLYTSTSLLSGLFLVLVLTIAGLPPSLGFWPKLLLLEAALAGGGVGHAGGGEPLALLLALCLLLNALLTLLAGARLWSRIFWRPAPEPADEPATARDAALPWAVGATSALTALVLIAGFWPAPVLDFGAAAATGLLDSSGYVRAVGLEPRP